ncbi:hypothetical protein [Bacillus wiedmannii]|uniref:hypothetical protein n=1 Tax=Bacillus wiedmannii TaxID=1890302 RepID=UPI003F90E2CE
MMKIEAGINQFYPIYSRRELLDEYGLICVVKVIALILVERFYDRTVWLMSAMKLDKRGDVE